MDKDFAQEWDAPRSIDTGAVAAKHQNAALKQIVTIRLDTDMLDWFKGAGPGYQTRINQILRQYMADHRDDAIAAKAN
ncbi:MAG: hypothetical protein JWP59_3036 [Massilia sp.]|jgi:uncharacterized protein (DUF4415 family)|nr:hypothetical protein [Massilia sp.]